MRAPLSNGGRGSPTAECVVPIGIKVEPGDTPKRIIKRAQRLPIWGVLSQHYLGRGGRKAMRQLVRACIGDNATMTTSFGETVMEGKEYIDDMDDNVRGDDEPAPKIKDMTNRRLVSRLDCAMRWSAMLLSWCMPACLLAS